MPTVKVGQNYVITIPDDIIEELMLREGDTLNWEIQEDGSFKLSLQEKETVELDISDEDLMKLFKLAHKRDITLNQLIEETMRDIVSRENKE